nr:uncharacterized protein LOC113690684 [Coffea arabica]
MIADFKKDMMKIYKMNDMELLHHFLGMEIYQYDNGTFICQKKYAENILVKFGMTDCKLMATPLVVSEKLDKKDVKVYTQSQSITYWSSQESVKIHQTTFNYNIKFSKGATLNLHVYCDSDWGGCLDNMKSTLGFCFSLGSGVFSWGSKKQQSVAQSF